MDDATQQVVRLALENWWCVFGGFGGLLYGYYRLPFFSHKHKQWRMLFRLEVVAVATAATALLMTAFVSAPDWYTKGIAILVVAPTTGMAAPLFYDFIWRPFLWPLLKTMARVVAQVAVETARAVARRFAKTVVTAVEAAGGHLDSDNTLVKIAKSENEKPAR